MNEAGHAAASFPLARKPRRHQIGGQRAHLAQVDAPQSCDVLLRQARHASAGAGHAGCDGADRVGIATEIGADHGRLPGIAPATSTTAKAAGTNSWEATLVPTRSTIRRIASDGGFTPYQPARPFDPRGNVGSNDPIALRGTKSRSGDRRLAASRQSAPSTPWLTAAATAAAAAMAIEVLCVARQVSATLATSASKRLRRHHDADRRDPHRRTVGVAGAPGLLRRHALLMASIARLVDGPSRS